MNDKILSEAVDYAIKIRQYLHSIPELGLQEYKTTELIKNELEKFDIDLSSYTTETGAVGIINGKYPGQVTAIRADIDALPLEEKTGLSYSSKTRCLMHACGHDGHTAILLGTAKILKQYESKLKGKVVLLFQPGEEGYHGGEKMIKVGALDNPKVENIIALHGWPYLKTGEVGAWSGQYMASSDSFYLSFRGKGGHGCRPYLAINPILAASQFALSVQNIIPNEIVTSQQAVISVCTINAGTVCNIIPDEVNISGTVRCLDKKLRMDLKKKIERVAEGSADTYGCTSDLNYEFGLPSLINDDETVKKLLNSAEKALGKEPVKQLDGPVMGSEDFSYMLDYVKKGAYMRLGIDDGQNERILHNSHFDFNDEAIKNALKVFVQYIFDTNGVVENE